MAEHAISSLTIDHVDYLAAPLHNGDLADWNTVDWYCVKALAKRRAGAVGFVEHAATEPELFDGFGDMLIQIAEVNVADPTRWSQTSVG